MVNRTAIVALRWVSFGFFFVAIVIFTLQLVSFSRLRMTFPPQMSIGGIPVGGLTQQQAADRLAQAYGVPVELHYGDAVIQVKPNELGFELDLSAMLAEAERQRVTRPFWETFWSYLWNSASSGGEVPLRAKVSEARMRAYLQNEIASRYDQPPTEAIPVPGSTTFTPGNAGTTLDIDRTVQLIDVALRSPANRVVKVALKQVSPARPSFRNLEIMLKQIIQSDPVFNGTAELYLLDLQTGQEINFALLDGEDIPTGVAFTAASTIKIPVMISVMRRVEDPIPPSVAVGLENMIEKSINEETDRLMRTVLDENLGPLEVSADLKKMGLVNTFLAGFFSDGAPLLRRFETPANSRTDVDTRPDIYNQTTTAEMGMILEDIYRCSKSGGGTLAVVFPGELTPNDCQMMINYLSKNEIGLLIEAGVPGGTRVAHKHGWLTDFRDGYIHTVIDAGIVYTPVADYVLVVAIYDPEQIVWDPANIMVARLSQAIYNYFNYK